MHLWNKPVNMTFLFLSLYQIDQNWNYQASRTLFTSSVWSLQIFRRQPPVRLLTLGLLGMQFSNTVHLSSSHLAWLQWFHHKINVEQHFWPKTFMRADSGLFCPWLYFQYVAQSQALLHRKGFENEYVHIRISHNRRLAVIFLTTRPVLEKTFDDP